MLKKIMLIILACFLTLSLGACGGNNGGDSADSIDPNDPFYGDWLYVTEDGIHELFCFYGNGKGCQQVLDIYTDMGYEYDEENLYISVYVSDPPVRYIYKYQVEDMDLFLENTETGITKHFVKQTD